MTDKTLQERFSRHLSAHLIGSQSVFKPSLYGENGEEPADLAWVAGRCVVIVNVTAGLKSLHYKRRHNNSQLHKWLRRWRQGEVLRGPGDISLGYHDVDVVVGISVVGVGTAASVIEDAQLAFAESKGNGKLCACATLSDNVFLRLAKRSVGIKDVIDFFEFLRARGAEVDDKDATDWLDYWEDRQVHEARQCFKEMLPSGDILNDAWRDTQIFLSGLKEATHREKPSRPLLCDLSMGDAVWLSVAERSMALQIAKPGEHGTVLMAARRKVFDYYLQIVVAAHLGKVIDDPNKLAYNERITVTSSLEFGPETPLRTVSYKEDGLGEGLYEYLREFRQCANRQSLTSAFHP